MDMLIFNRWGDVVFHSSYQENGWNGLNQKNNARCKEDTYVYLVKAVDLFGDKHEKTGRVTLIR